jgi:hypothetical protein
MEKACPPVVVNAGRHVRSNWSRASAHYWQANAKMAHAAKQKAAYYINGNSQVG